MVKKKVVKKKAGYSSFHKNKTTLAIMTFFVFLLLVGIADFALRPTGNATVTGTRVITGPDGTDITVFTCSDGRTVGSASSCATGSDASASGAASGGLDRAGIVNDGQAVLPDIFNFWTPYGASGSLIRYLAFVLIFMLVYWTVDGFVGEDKTRGKSWGLVLGYMLFSGIVAFLSINFILTDELIALMAPYSALGATFIVIIPFLIVLMFTAKLVTTTYLSVQRVLVERTIWLTYAAFVGYYLATLSYALNQFITYVMAGIAVISFLIFLFNKTFIKWIRSLNRKVNEANANAKMHEEKLQAAERNHAQALHQVEADRDRLERERRKLERDLEKLQGKSVDTTM